MSASSTAAEASTASEALAAAAALKQAEALLESRRLAHAVLALNHAEFLGAAPDQCSAGRWLAAMLHGDWSAAWRECDAIRARGGSDPDRFWQGEDFRGKRVVLRCLHGFGDAVQFLSYAPLLCTMASKLIVEVAPAIVHGGPWPATSDGRSTSVGTRAIERFVRPVCFQDCPADLLPLELREENPLGIRRMVDGVQE